MDLYSCDIKYVQKKMLILPEQFQMQRQYDDSYMAPIKATISKRHL